jgi:hypothetical protein
MNAASRYLTILLLAGTSGAWAENDPVNLTAAIRDEPYAQVLRTNKPARFEKVGGNAVWLAITPEGALTGTPPRGAPEKSIIVVKAFPLDLTGKLANPQTALTRTFIIPVHSKVCSGRNTDNFAWCDAAPSTANGSRPRQGERLAFEPVPIGEAAKRKGPLQASQVRPSAPLAHEFDLTADCTQLSGCIVQFDRLLLPKGALGRFDTGSRQNVWDTALLKELPSDPMILEVVKAIDGSKVFLSGSVLIRMGVADCRF